MITHTVVAGETLGTIARRYLGNTLRYPELARFNNLADPNRIFIGQKINIPESTDELAPVNVTATKIPEPFQPDGGDEPFPVTALPEISGGASRDWIIPAMVAAAILWAMQKS